YHGALLDAQLLAEVYLAMTGGQSALILDAEGQRNSSGGPQGPRLVDRSGLTLKVQRASDAEQAAHAQKLQEIAKASGAPALWQADEA
ncbi:MAG: DNA polymerase III subunit epsilon, partial [Chloroflexota bacterium]